MIYLMPVQFFGLEIAIVLLISAAVICNDIRNSFMFVSGYQRVSNEFVL